MDRKNVFQSFNPYHQSHYNYDITDYGYPGYPSVIYEEDPNMIAESNEDQVIPNFILGPTDSQTSSILWQTMSTEPEGYSSLPVEIEQVNNIDASFDKIQQKPGPWEAEDINDFIITFDETNNFDIQASMEQLTKAEISSASLEQLENCHTMPSSSALSSVGVTMRKSSKEINTIYSSITSSGGSSNLFTNNKIDNCDQIMITSGGPVEKYPKIMTTSCYGALNTVWKTSQPSRSSFIAKSQEDLNTGGSLDTELNMTNSNSLFWLTTSTDDMKYPSNNMTSLSQKGSRDDIINSLENSLYESSPSMTSSSNNIVGINNLLSHQSSNVVGIAEIVESDLQAIRRLLDTETVGGGGGVRCPSCQMPFDKGKKRKLIDTCGHERCYSCMFKNEICPICNQQSIELSDTHGSSINVRDSIQDANSGSNELRNSGGISKSRFSSVTHLLQSHRKESKSHPKHLLPKQSSQTNLAMSKGLESVACATPPQNRRRLFNTKNLRSSFGQRKCSSSGLENASALTDSRSLNNSSRSDSSVPVVVMKRQHKSDNSKTTDKSHRLSLGSTSYAGHLSSLVFGKIKSLWTAQASTTNVGLNQLASDDEVDHGKHQHSSVKNKENELQSRLEFYLDSSTTGNPRRHVEQQLQSYSSLASTNTSPVSTLTGSSDADNLSRVAMQESGIYNTGSNSIGSLMSMSISEQSNCSLSPVTRRHSVTTSQAGQVEELAVFKNRKVPIRRSARSGAIKGPIDPKIRFAQYRQGPQLTLKPLFFEVPVQEKEPLFVGRQWLLREISNTLIQTDSQGILIHGNPGTGKTAILLQLVEQSCFGRRRNLHANEQEGIYCQINLMNDRIKALSSYVVAYHFCQADNNATCLVPDFIHSLAAQLCQAPQLSAYRDYLLSETHLQNILSVKECIANPERALKMGILEPLISLRRTGNISAKNCIILIDALCEAEYHRPDHGDTITTFLAKLITYFPPWLKIVATVRSQMIEFVKMLPLTRLSLDTSNDAIQKDIYEYCTMRLKNNPAIQNNISPGKEHNAANQLKFLQYLISLAKGSFLYAKLALDLIECGHLVIKSTSYKVLPVSLAQIFLLRFNLKFPTGTKYDKVCPILNVCLAALYPLTLVEIFYSVNALYSDSPITWQQFVENFNELSDLVVKRMDNTYMLFHPSLREWLIRRDQNESNKFLCDLRAGHAAIAFRLARLQAPLDSETALELGHHVLKAHIYRNGPQNQSPRDLQAYWIASVADNISSSLCTLRNVYSPNIKVSRLLLLAGASPDNPTEFLGNAPILCIAASEGCMPMVNLLLEFGGDVEKCNSQGSTPLMLASAKGHCDVVRQLVAAGSSIGRTDTTGRCALVHAARSGKLHVVKYLLGCEWISMSNTSDVSLLEAAQQSLIAAASQDSTNIVEELLDSSEVRIDAQDSISGETALTAASKNGYHEIVTVLLSRGASVGARNKKEVSPFLIAVKEGHISVIERLLQYSVDIEDTDGAGKTALITAAQEGYTEIMEIVLRQGATLEAQDSEGLTALSWACLRGHLQAASYLIDKLANLHHADKTGRTPLDLAAYQGSAVLVQLLLDKGSQVEHVDVIGMRPLDRAIACRNVQIVQVFLKRGAKLGPTTWAMASGKPEIMLLLLNKLLEDGNILYKKNRLQEACHRYQYALKKFPTDHSTDHLSTFTQLKVNFLLNHSRCNRKMNNIAESIDLATQAIELKPDSYEGYHLRAKAYFEVGDILKAMMDSKSALDRAQSVSNEIKNVLIRFHDEISRRRMAMAPDPTTADAITDL